MGFIAFCFISSIVIGSISGYLKTSGQSYSRNDCSSENNYYVLFLDWNKDK
jgi:LytS/YehU family sensor histidine kinase